MNYSNIITTLEEVSKGKDDYASKASGLLTQMESFNVFFWSEAVTLNF